MESICFLLLCGVLKYSYLSPECISFITDDKNNLLKTDLENKLKSNLFVKSLNKSFVCSSLSLKFGS